jgi:hypothetical protein
VHDKIHGAGRQQGNQHATLAAECLSHDTE